VFTVAEAAKCLGISVSLVYGLISGRKLKYCRVGNRRGQIRIPEDAVDECLARCTFDTQEPESPPQRVRPKHIKLRRE